MKQNLSQVYYIIYEHSNNKISGNYLLITCFPQVLKIKPHYFCIILCDLRKKL